MISLEISFFSCREVGVFLFVLVAGGVLNM